MNPAGEEGHGPPARQTVWQGVLERHVWNAEFLQAKDQLADACRAGDWERVFRAAEAVENWPNSFRVGGSSWFTPLHQAAWHGAPIEVVETIIRAGAWRTLLTADGRTASDIARGRGHGHLLGLLEPVLTSVPFDTVRVDEHLRALILERSASFAPRLRFPQTSVLLERVREPEPTRLGFTIPGMYGGFHLQLADGGVLSESWSRVVGGSGQEHLVTEDGYTLIREGFV